jgi:hypothetical protein
MRGLVTFVLVHNDDVQLIGGAACREHRRTHVDHDHAVRPRSGADFERATTWIAAPGLLSPGCPAGLSPGFGRLLYDPIALRNRPICQMR